MCTNELHSMRYKKFNVDVLTGTSEKPGQLSVHCIKK